jgi:hypothetical protein
VGGDIEVAWNPPADVVPSNYIIEVAVNGGSWNLVSSNVAGNANSYINQGCRYFYIKDDIVKHRVVPVYPNGQGTWIESGTIVANTCP